MVAMRYLTTLPSMLSSLRSNVVSVVCEREMLYGQTSMVSNNKKYFINNHHFISDICLLLDMVLEDKFKLLNIDCISVAQTRSANFACRINNFSWHYVRFAHFSCRMCLLFNIFRRSDISSFQNSVSIKRKIYGFLRRWFRFKFRCSYIYNKV